MIDFQALRNKILDKAIRGELVPQLETEQIVGEFVCVEEVPFTIPNNWKWVPLKEIASSNIGLTFSPKDISSTGTPILRSSNIQNGEIDLLDLKRVSNIEVPKKCLINEGDILICARNGSRALVGKCALMPKMNEQFGFGAFMAVVRSQFNPYLKYFFESEFFRKCMLDVNNSTTINQITQKKLLDALVPLPPCGEQARIIEKIEALFYEIEQAEKAYEELSGPLSEQFRSLLLDKAIRGELVPQLDDEPSVEAFADEPEDVPFAIPEKWKWARLESVGTFISGRTPKSHELNDVGEIPYFKVSDMNTPGNEKFLVKTSLYLKENKGRVYPSGSIVYPKNGGAVFTNKRRILIKPSVVDLNTGGFVPGSHLDQEYIFALLCSLDFEKISKGTALPTIDQVKLRNFPIPVPPLEEQRRIVQKLDSLLSEVDKLIR